jgi:hypothetical protein
MSRAAWLNRGSKDGRGEGLMESRTWALMAGLPTACAQICTKAGILNVPEWYAAGEVYAKSEGAVPTSE